LTFVADTSVALKWYAPEEDSERAAELLGGFLVAPDLILAELGNALWKKAWQGEALPAQAVWLRCRISRPMSALSHWRRWRVRLSSWRWSWNTRSMIASFSLWQAKPVRK
jgi:predicted nucleic acid-binding protein